MVRRPGSWTCRSPAAQTAPPSSKPAGRQTLPWPGAPPEPPSVALPTPSRSHGVSKTRGGRRIRSPSPWERPLLAVAPTAAATSETRPPPQSARLRDSRPPTGPPMPRTSTWPRSRRTSPSSTTSPPATAATASPAAQGYTAIRHLRQEQAAGGRLHRHRAALHLRLHLRRRTQPDRRLAAAATPTRSYMFGAHLDSVAAGPGINDNGSGSADAAGDRARPSPQQNPTMAKPRPVRLVDRRGAGPQRLRVLRQLALRRRARRRSRRTSTSTWSPRPTAATSSTTSPPPPASR